jgi:uncharacterized protein YjbJ (UPF0337 family)
LCRGADEPRTDPRHAVRKRIAGNAGRCSKLTDDDLDDFAGDRDPLSGKVQERYGSDNN